MSAPLLFDRDQLASLCRRHNIRLLALFGSVLRHEESAESDVDLLAEFEPDASPTLLDIAIIESELSKLISGRRVDIRTKQDLSRHFRDEVIGAAEVQYESI